MEAAPGEPELEGHVALCGEGPLYRALLPRLRAAETAVAIIDADLDYVTACSSEGAVAVFGDASRPDVLKAAGIERAGVLVIATPSLASRMAIALAARGVRPDLPIVAVASDTGERAWLEEFGVTAVADVLTPAVEQVAATVRRTLDAGER